MIEAHQKTFIQSIATIDLNIEKEINQEIDQEMMQSRNTLMPHQDQIDQDRLYLEVMFL